MKLELEFIARLLPAAFQFYILLFNCAVVERGQIELFISVNTRHDKLSGPLPPPPATPAQIILVLTKMFLLMSHKWRVAEQYCLSDENIK